MMSGSPGKKRRVVVPRPGTVEQVERHKRAAPGSPGHMHKRAEGSDSRESEGLSVRGNPSLANHEGVGSKENVGGGKEGRRGGGLGRKRSLEVAMVSGRSGNGPPKNSLGIAEKIREREEALSLLDRLPFLPEAEGKFAVITQLGLYRIRQPAGMWNREEFHRFRKESKGEVQHEIVDAIDCPHMYVKRGLLNQPATPEVFETLDEKRSLADILPLINADKIEKARISGKKKLFSERKATVKASLTSKTKKGQLPGAAVHEPAAELKRDFPEAQLMQRYFGEKMRGHCAWCTKKEEFKNAQGKATFKFRSGSRTRTCCSKCLVYLHRDVKKDEHGVPFKDSCFNLFHSERHVLHSSGALVNEVDDPADIEPLIGNDGAKGAPVSDPAATEKEPRG
eukprot:Nk52_evm4s244 gene=Nk52_evmTU4s244